MSDSPSRRLVKLLSEGVAEEWYAHMAIRLYNLLKEAYTAGEEGGFLHGRGYLEDGLTFEEWMSLDGE